MFQAAVLFCSLVAAVIGSIVGDSAQANYADSATVQATADVESRPAVETEMTDSFLRRGCRNGSCRIHVESPHVQTDKTQTVKLIESDWVENRFCRPNQPPQNPPGFYPPQPTVPQYPSYPQPPRYINVPRSDGLMSILGAGFGAIACLVAAIAGGLMRNSDEKKADADAAEAAKTSQATKRAALLEKK
jgi:hypothetical protein